MAVTVVQRKILSVVEKIHNLNLNKNTVEEEDKNNKLFKQEMDVVENVWKHFQNLINHAYVRFLKMLEILNFLQLAVKYVDVLVVILKIKKILRTVKVILKAK